ncbi:topoisomerase 3-alpha [Seminavis robusta]|uniref:DNA topoisomerase n=1 Tax=Seminavis robusta TaxID=568900 RepID=A0A9N8HAA0_9STRA|nr:topoisomerase 3-alpha [Seminavis robusta]|eukprot:Sro287_g108620.1 topoisomerase 3-alpha (960) ;mRNA; r:42927-45973
MSNREIRVLNVAEKPSVARALAGVFSGMQGSRQHGGPRREAAQIFEHHNVRFPEIFRQGNGQRSNAPIKAHTMITTSVRGHLSNRDFPDGFGWSACDPGELFHAPLEISYKGDMNALQRMLGNLARNCQAVILWLDCDREGEAIADEVRTVCLEKNQRLSPHMFRPKFSTVLPGEIQRALQSLGRVNENFVDAVNARSELDLRVGAAFSRFQTLRLQKKFSGFSEQVVSYGPCQFPTLGFIVERWARMETFVSEKFWSIELRITVPVPGADNDQNVNPQPGRTRSIEFTWKRGRLYDRLMTLVLYESCMDARDQATVIDLRGTQKKKWRPVPLSTVELQKRASRFLRIGSETLMAAAESLYNNGYISYPRTETEVFRQEFQHRPLIQDLAGNGGEFRQYASKLLSNNGQHFQNPRAGRNDDKAHPPITPCKAVDPATIPDTTQRSIYKLIVQHYLACCSKDAVGKETQLIVRIGTEDFTAKGLMIVERNWLEVYHPHERWSTQQGELPELEIGSRIVPSTLTMKEGETTPPQPLTEAELIALMDRHGIGTDATIAAHITTIQERQYATKDAGQRFLPSPLGIALVEGYNSMGYQLNKPDLRREVEAECNQVAAGTKQKAEIMNRILEKMRQIFMAARAEATKLDAAVGRRFSRVGVGNQASQVVKQQFSLCGTCSSMMSLKQENSNNHQNNNNNNRNNNRVTRRPLLLYCQTCSEGFRLPVRGKVVPKRQGENGGPPFKCPICSYQVIDIQKGEGYDGNGYSMCPKCYHDPPIEHGGISNDSGFRCFQCTHPTCSLAAGTSGSGIDVFPCPFCSQASRQNNQNAVGQVRLKSTQRGSTMLSCSNYSKTPKCTYVIWLPNAASKVEVEEASCASCSTNGRSVRKLKFTWKSGSVPPPYDRETIACVLCDACFRQDFDFSLPQVRPNQRGGTGQRGGPGRGHGRGRGGRGGRRTNSRGSGR